MMRKIVTEPEVDPQVDPSQGTNVLTISEGN